MIEIIGQDIILSKLVKEINTDKELNLETPVFPITGEVIADQIVTTLQDLGLEIKNTRGQRYDGASNISRDNVGVQRRKREPSSIVVYVHQWPLSEPSTFT